MERKIEFYEEENTADYACNLTNCSIEECVESWRESLDVEIYYPCEIVVFGYAEKSKDNYVPNGVEILNDVHDDLYNNGYVDDYSEKYYTDEMKECSDKLSDLIKKNLAPYYEAVKKYTVKVNEDSFEILEEGDIK